MEEFAGRVSAFPIMTFQSPDYCLFLRFFFGHLFLRAVVHDLFGVGVKRLGSRRFNGRCDRVAAARQQPGDIAFGSVVRFLGSSSATIRFISLMSLRRSNRILYSSSLSVFTSLAGALPLMTIGMVFGAESGRYFLMISPVIRRVSSTAEICSARFSVAGCCRASGSSRAGAAPRRRG